MLWESDVEKFCGIKDPNFIGFLYLYVVQPYFFIKCKFFNYI